ncbi:MAG: glutathione S-transferase family protein [Deltaproteobacteria bacterium]|nr:glutathione S-transferase family protein [Deltaproteobacteria bacterium]MCB9788648.1 glutathione S-transferase family protein [Deltaproteobacteria bacterium]
MGKLVEGRWHDVWYPTQDGRFQREESSFRDRVTADGSSGFAAATGRYHLYVSWACPWAHRTLVMRKRKGLEDVISVSSVAPLMLEHGWEFDEDYPDPLGQARYLHEVYTAAQSDYTGRVTVPVLWDKERETIVNNESSEILRMMNGAFDAFTEVRHDFYPEALRSEIDAVNDEVYDNVNNGVYRCGFATTQEAYEDAFDDLFSTLDRLEQRLEGHEWLVGDQETEADWRLFTTLLRFDPVYHFHFKCNLRRLRDYPNLWAFTQRLYALPGIAETVDLPYIKRHYYGSHKTINPHGIIPVGPAIDFGDG